jgi:hypothetical protein
LEHRVAAFGGTGGEAHESVGLSHAGTTFWEKRVSIYNGDEVKADLEGQGK